MMFSDIKAVIDTSAIIQLRMERYAPDVFPRLNGDIERTAKGASLVTVDRVIEELITKASTRASTSRAVEVPTSEQTLKWARTELPLINDVVSDQTIAEIANLTADIAGQHQRWSNGEPADPMVIAAADVLGCAVISGEIPQIQDKQDPKPISESARIWNEFGQFSSWIRIPDICLLRGIQHLDLLSFFRSQGWSF